MKEKEALFYSAGEDGKVVCELCNHHCRIKPGRRGICGVRENRDGKLYSLVYGRLISENIDPIEKKPLFNFLPGTTSYSIATVGCNFKCLHCQNWQISQYPHLHKGEVVGEERTPEEVVNAALVSGARSISYTYVEPTIFYEFAYDCAVLAKEQGLRNVFVSNGYMSPEVTRHLSGVLDGINIDLKAFTDKFYREVCRAKLQPVKDNIRLMQELGVWVEVTTLIIPGWNDSPEELRHLAQFIKGVDRSIPWHVTAFYPTYKMQDRPRTPVSSLRRARDIGLEEGLRFVYEGNVSGEGGENTYCPACGSELISRLGFGISRNLLKDGKCAKCGETIEGVWG
ncbi:MAG TPA: AmmeMemoRadiSam system radical SAM enzyme [Thermodesulfobacteriaceae bacterium]|nr:AmmeMemoRadiSam system radical SAM enzyme [Thermodesulfobacteriaceae bacterium]